MSMPKLKRYDDDDIARLAHLIGEDVESRFKAQFEIFDDIREKVNRIPKIEEQLDNIESDMVVVKTILKEHNRDIRALQAVAHSH